MAKMYFDHVKGYVSVNGAFPISPDLILLQYAINGSEGYWVNIVNREGEAYFEEDQPFEGGLIQANQGNKLYWIEEPQTDDESHSIIMAEVNLVLLSN